MKVLTKVAAGKVEDAARNLHSPALRPVQRRAVGQAVSAARIYQERVSSATKALEQITRLSRCDPTMIEDSMSEIDRIASKFLKEEGIEI